MPTAAESIEAWLAQGRFHAWLARTQAMGPYTATLYIRDATVVTLPPLPGTLGHLHCDRCDALTDLGNLPALATLSCTSCPALAQLPPLPATLRQLYCNGCTALVQLPPLPVNLKYLTCDASVTLPDAYPDIASDSFQLLLNDASEDESRLAWRARVGAQHAADRRRVAACLPPLALLFV